MSSRQKIDELMLACEKCAGDSEQSYNEHFGECPKCKEYSEQADRLNEQIVFLEGLAAKPLDSRKQLLGSRMRSFLSLGDDEAVENISDLLDGLADVSEDARYKVVKARTDLMMEIPKEHREKLMGFLGQIMKDWSPERKMIEKQAVMTSTEDYFFLKRKMVRRKFSKLLE